MDDEEHRDFWSDRERLERLERLASFAEQAALEAGLPMSEVSRDVTDLRECVRLAPFGGKRSRAQRKPKHNQNRKAEALERHLKVFEVFERACKVRETAGGDATDTALLLRAGAPFGITSLSQCYVAVAAGRAETEKRRADSGDI